MSFFNKDSKGFDFCKKQPDLLGFYYGVRRIEYFSQSLDRKIIIDVVFPLQAGLLPSTCNVLILNDGQDLADLDYIKTLDRLHSSTSLKGLVTLAVHAGDRLQEYGVAGTPDYKGRGKRAGAYQSFIKNELFTHIFKALELTCTPENVAIAGFSLGALAAFDFAWTYPDKAGIAGCFSGSFWWRTKELEAGYGEQDRIMHRKVAQSDFTPDVKVWMEVGTEDEAADRDKNGVIDAINDVKDLLNELRGKGVPEQNLFYLEVEGGQHNQSTWAKVMPDFLKWAFRDN